MKTETCLPGNLSIKHFLVVLVGLVVSDSLVSQFVTEYGFGYEGNPFLHGLSGANSLLIKLAGALLAAITLWDVHKTRPKSSLEATLSSVVVYTGIVFWNVAVFLIAQR
jgi:hypothetical protein